MTDDEPGKEGPAPTHVSPPGLLQSSGFIFLANVGQLADFESKEICSGYDLRRASSEEADMIRRALSQLSPDKGRWIYEIRWPHAGGALELLEESDWRYYVVNFTDRYAQLSKLETALSLHPLGLEISLWFLHPNEKNWAAQGYKLASLFQLYQSVEYQDATFFKTVTVKDLIEIHGLCSQIEKHDHSVLNLEPLFVGLKDVKALPPKSPMRYLSYFAILEALVTHSPKDGDPYDSITRQVKKKMALLNRRFPRELPYGVFGNASTDTVWGKLYSYRSKIAHGSNADFSSGDLSTLHGADRALAFLREATLAVVRQALSEPELLADLREC